MRFAPLLLIFFAFAASALAQQQDRTLEQRILRPNEHMTYDVRQSSFSTGNSITSKNARVKEFGFEQKYTPKTYAAQPYAGSKSAWMGNFKFSTAEANTKGKYQIPNLSKQADTKALPVTDARESGKANPVKEYDKARRPYLGEEAKRMEKGINPNSQHTVGWTGTMKEMTIDDVRDLLNKNR